MGGRGLVIFDCDGVLVDSEVISNRVLASMLRDQGLSMTVAEARSAYQGLLLSEVLEHAETKLGRPLPAGWIECYERQRTRAFELELAPVPGARQAVERVTRAGMAKCVASQGKLEKTRLSLKLTGLDELFEERMLFSARSVARGKPHPDLFLHAALDTGTPPADCVVVEDTPSGVTAAVSAGMRAIGYAADSDAAALRLAGAEIIHSLTELPGLLGLD